MNRNLMIFISIVILIFSLSGCSINDEKTDQTTDTLIEKWVDDSSFRVVGKTEDISYLIDEGKKVSSSDPSVVVVNGKKLEMKSKGFATIICKYDNKIEKYYYIVLSQEEFDNYEATFESNRVIMPIGATNTWSVGWSDFAVSVQNPALIEVEANQEGFTANAIGYGGSYITVTTNSGVILTYYIYAYPEHED